MIDSLKLKYRHMRHLLKDNTCSMLIWLLNLFPWMGGFPLLTNKISAVFMIIHCSLLVYVLIVGTVAYLMYVAEDFFESVISLFNISISGVVLSNTLWFLSKKKDLNVLLSLATKNDNLLVNSDRLVDDYRKLLRKIKIVIIVYYVFHLVNGFLIYFPSRMMFLENFSVVSCVGLDLTSSPRIEICMFLLTIQEATCVVVVGAYDVIVLFIFSHTTAIFQILYQDMENFTEISKIFEKSEEMSTIASNRLKNIVARHSLLLHTVDKMQHLYSVAIGCGFTQNAVSLCLFFVLPIEESWKYGPLIYYFLFVFFLYCFYGQKLTNASEKFKLAVYASGWENLCVKEQKSILLILKQAQKPIVLRAFDIIPISIYTFASVMQTIYKFVTIFKF